MIKLTAEQHRRATVELGKTIEAVSKEEARNDMNRPATAAKILAENKRHVIKLQNMLENGLENDWLHPA